MTTGLAGRGNGSELRVHRGICRIIRINDIADIEVRQRRYGIRDDIATHWHHAADQVKAGNQGVRNWARGDGAYEGERNVGGEVVLKPASGAWSQHVSAIEGPSVGVLGLRFASPDASRNVLTIGGRSGMREPEINIATRKSATAVVQHRADRIIRTGD